MKISIKKIGLLPRVIIAIILGLLLGMVLPAPAVRIFVTFNSIFASFLFFCIPLIIVGLVAPGIADLEKNAGRLLAITTLLAYGSTIFSGFFTYFSCRAVFPLMVEPNAALTTVDNPENSLLTPFFTIGIPPLFDIMAALVLAFILGIGIAACKGETLKLALNEFKLIVERVISVVIVPLLPVYIFGIFLNMSHSGTAFTIIVVFGKIIGVIFVLHIPLEQVKNGMMFCFDTEKHVFHSFGCYIVFSCLQFVINFVDACIDCVQKGIDFHCIFCFTDCFRRFSIPDFRIYT